MQHGATPCNIWQSVLPGLDPESLRHKHLAPRQMAAVYLVLQGLSDIDVARRLGVTRSTVFRWRTRSEVFRDELDHQRRGMYQQATDRLGSMVAPALQMLERQIADPANASNPRVAVRVASTILRLALQQHQPKPPLAREQKEKERTAGMLSALDAYINAPMPGGTSARRAGKRRATAHEGAE